MPTRAATPRVAIARANVDGTHSVLNEVTPVLAPRSPELLAASVRGLDGLAALLDRYHRADGTWLGLADLTVSQREELDGRLGVLLETLAPIPDVLELPRDRSGLNRAQGGGAVKPVDRRTFLGAGAWRVPARCRSWATGWVSGWHRRAGHGSRGSGVDRHRWAWMPRREPRWGSWRRRHVARGVRRVRRDHR